MTEPEDNRTTIYPNRQQRRAESVPDPQWASPVQQLLKNNYAFLPLTYTAPGYLFRGVSNLPEVISTAVLDLEPGDHALARLERELGVVMMSADVSDALAVSRVWTDEPGRAVVVLKADAFADYYKRRAAAVLGFADPGVVFRYPFMLGPLPLSVVQALVVHGNAHRLTETLLKEIPHPPQLLGCTGAEPTRQSFEQALTALLEAENLIPAQSKPAADYPRPLPRR